MTGAGVAAARTPAALARSGARVPTLARFAARAAAAAALVWLVACSRGHVSPASMKEAHRVVSVAPATTESLFAIGAGDRVVGRSRFCDWPPEAARLPVVGGVIDADLEAIVQLAPDLVVGSPGPASTRLSDKLAAFGIATWFPAVESLAAIDVLIAGLGERTGHEAEARQLAATLDARRASVALAVAGEPAPRVLMVLDVDPVVATGPRDFVDEMIRAAGGVNVLATGASWQTLDFEQIVALDPDVVLDASMTGGGSPPRINADTPGWVDVRAAREGHVVPIDDPRVLRPGPRVADGLATLARALHPRAHVPSW